MKRSAILWQTWLAAVLISPYLSLYDMAFQHVGPIAALLHHNFNNEAALRTLQQRQARPEVEIFHGDRDQIVPVWMSRRMHHEFPWVIYRELLGYEHIRIVTDAAPLIAGEMAAMP